MFGTCTPESCLVHSSHNWIFRSLNQAKARQEGKKKKEEDDKNSRGELFSAEYVKGERNKNGWTGSLENK